jgi:ribonuclease HI
MIEIYTDGACKGNPGYGGYAGLIYVDDLLVKTVHSNRIANTTNNQMELKAIISSLEYLNTLNVSPTTYITVFTDSNYALQGITSWINGWIRNNWTTANKQPVKNKELWQELLKLNSLFPNITYEHVKAHADNVKNNKVDRIASDIALGIYNNE